MHARGGAGMMETMASSKNPTGPGSSFAALVESSYNDPELCGEVPSLEAMSAAAPDVPEDIDAVELRDLAVRVAGQAAALIRTRRAELAGPQGAGLHAHHTKSSAVDPVTEVDEASESFITGELLAARPFDGLLGEEGAARESSSGVTWVVDPIDGTVNFLYGVPDYAVSIGAVVDGEPVAGCVVNVAQDVTYAAALGHGATVVRGGSSPQPVHPRTETDPALSLVATGFGYEASRRRAQAEVLVRLLPRVRDIRRIGAAALDICRVAEGSVDVYYEHGIKAWDCAAGTIIAREAGCAVVHPGMEADGKNGAIFFAAQPSVAPAAWVTLSEAKGTDKIPA